MVQLLLVATSLYTHTMLGTGALIKPRYRIHYLLAADGSRLSGGAGDMGDHAAKGLHAWDSQTFPTWYRLRRSRGIPGLRADSYQRVGNAIARPIGPKRAYAHDHGRKLAGPSPNHEPACVGPMRFAMSTNSLATLRTVIAASALVERVLATRVRAQVIGQAIPGRQTRQRMWDAFCKELWEIAWLASLVGGLSIAGLALAVILVQP